MSRRHKCSAAMSIAALCIAACSQEESPVALPEQVPVEVAPEIARVSKFGEYSGYSEERFSEWVRESQYVTVRDGTKLAVDIVRPAVDGVPVAEPLPVLWTHSRYHRNLDAVLRVFRQRKIEAAKAAGEEPPDLEPLPEGVISQVDGNPTLKRLLKHGYVIASVGVRGSGASYGRFEGLFSPAETADAFDIMEWLSKQPWSDGNLGMYGASYLGISQYMAASTHHPALKAIMPNVAAFNMYDVLYRGGIYRKDMMDHWGKLTRDLDTTMKAPPVDADKEEVMLNAAIEEHRDNWDVVVEYGAANFRDHNTPSFAWQHFGPGSALDRINASGVAIYHWGGWHDLFSHDELLWLVNYPGPDKLGMGPWTHAQDVPPVAELRAKLDATEHHRWFDYWLKGIDNGVMDEPQANFAIVDIPGKEWTWSQANHWPPAGVTDETYYFSQTKSGSVASNNDGTLANEPPQQLGVDRYAVDPTTTTGSASRWDNAVGQGVLRYPDLIENDTKSMTYTTPPLDEDIAVVGAPVVTLSVETTTSDADFYVLLEEVDAEGYSHYVTEGMLRGSHRKLGEAPWDNLGLPFHRSFAEDLEPMVPGQKYQLEFLLLATSHLFNKGNRIRIAVMGADQDNTEAPPAPDAVFRVHVGGEAGSRIDLPILSSVN